MSTIEKPLEEARERDVLVRSFEADLSAGDGRTIDMRIVPFGERATVADGLGGLPKGQPYQEEWMPGVFDKQLSAANRIFLNFRHEEGISNVVGHGVALRSERDGYHGSFRVLAGQDGDKTLELVNAGVLTGASVEAFPLKSVRSSTGVVQRVRAHLDAVALCPQGAFQSAVVTAVREQSVMLDEDLLPTALSQEIVERCRRLGIPVPAQFGETIERAFSDAPWDGSASRWPTAEAYCSACAIDLNPSGKTKLKTLCHLPYKEPGSGTVNLAGVRAALQRLGEGFPKDASASDRNTARETLQRLLAEAKSN